MIFKSYKDKNLLWIFIFSVELHHDNIEVYQFHISRHISAEIHRIFCSPTSKYCKKYIYDFILEQLGDYIYATIKPRLRKVE